MKRISVILILALLAFAGCKEEDEGSSLATSTLYISVAANDTERKTWVDNTDDWSVEIKKDAQSWLSYEKKVMDGRDSLTFIFTVNKSVAPRKTLALLHDHTLDKYFELDINQYGITPNFYFSPHEVAVKADAVSSKLKLTLNTSSFKIISQPAWVTKIDTVNIDTYTKEVLLTLDKNNSINFRRDSIVFEAKWSPIDKTELVSLNIQQYGAGSLESDKKTLEAIKTKMGGTSWKDGYEWDVTKEISTWKGVVIEDIGEGIGQRVVGLMLNEIGLSGAIAKEIGDLAYLKVLWMNDNPNVTGSIPTEIGNLVLMQNLRLGKTSLTGSLPLSISKMKNITNLSINNTGINGITGSVPNEYGELQKLVFLDLSGNNLTGTLPESVGEIVDMEDIFMNNNQFTGDIPFTYTDNLLWLYWDVTKTICPQRGVGFTKCG